jgi:hypothetical protein
MTPTRRDGLILLLILDLAAVLRFIGLPGRGAWDDDQGNAMTAMLMWVRDGQVPLLGPLSSIGTAHHGVGFYWVLAPGAFLTDANPVAAAATLAVVGVAGVAATWWLGRTVGGPVAGHIAGLLMAVSPSAIDGSTFVWNSNIVAPAAALAFAAGWHAWRTRRARWWLASAVGMVLMLHGHLLAAIALPPLVTLLVVDVLRRPRADRRSMLGPALGAVVIVIAGYVPALMYELRNGFPETTALFGYDPEPPAGYDVPPLIIRPLIVVWRILVWPVSGPVKSAVLGGAPAAIITYLALVVAASGKGGVAKQFALWTIGTVIWAVTALTFISPTLATFTPGLPNDQYHAWLDPILFTVIGMAVARLVARSPATVFMSLAAAIVVTCVGLSLAVMPPLSSPDGGWPVAADTAAKIRKIVGDQPVAVIGVAKSGGSLEFPLRRQRSVTAPSSDAGFLVVTCDPLFEGAIGAPCGGPAEMAYAQRAGFPNPRLIDRFDDSPRRVVCVFRRQ